MDLGFGKKIKFKTKIFSKKDCIFHKHIIEGLIVGHKDNHGGLWRVEYDAPHEYNGLSVSIHPTAYIYDEDIIEIIE